jgi:dUTP pyrophosphatase
MLNESVLDLGIHYLDAVMESDFPLVMHKLGDGVDTRLSHISTNTAIGRLKLQWAHSVTITGEELEYIFVPKGMRFWAHLGFSAQLPEGYKAFNLLRSSTADKYKIRQTNAVGLIDETFCGDEDEWLIPLIADEDTFMFRYERIGQFTVEKSNQLNLTVKSSNNVNRGGLGAGTAHIK